jgi:hypothetical protein
MEFTIVKPKTEIHDTKNPKVCGIVMPISECDGCAEHHWVEVKSIISDAVEAAGFSANLVSDARDVGVIHERIVQNLYDNPIVVCDVSGRNANVMFELGMRLAFDKPAIIIKDDMTKYSFDTSGIEHLGYPRDLRFSRIVEFKKQLADRITATYDRSQTDKNYTTFLKRFSKVKVARMEENEVSSIEFLQKELGTLKEMIGTLLQIPANTEPNAIDRSGVKSAIHLVDVVNTLNGRSSDKREELMQRLMEIEKGQFDKLIRDVSKFDAKLARQLRQDREFHEL